MRFAIICLGCCYALAGAQGQALEDSASILPDSITSNQTDSSNLLAPLLNLQPKPPGRGKPWVRALQSAVLPGWGQAANGEWIRAGVYFIGEAFLAYDAFYFWEHQYSRYATDHGGRIYDRDTAYGIAVWYSLAAVLAAGDAYYSASGRRETSPTRAAFRSVFFPGWGQLANGKRWKAMTVFMIQTGLGIGAFTQHERYLYYHGLGQSTEAQFFKNDRNRLIWWIAGSVIYSGVDAFVDCHLRDWDVSETLSWAPVYFPEQKTAGVAVRFFLQP